MGSECERDNLAVAFFVNCHFNVMGKYEGNILLLSRRCVYRYCVLINEVSWCMGVLKSVDPISIVSWSAITNLTCLGMKNNNSRSRICTLPSSDCQDTPETQHGHSRVNYTVFPGLRQMVNTPHNLQHVCQSESSINKNLSLSLLSLLYSLWAWFTAVRGGTRCDPTTVSVSQQDRKTNLLSLPPSFL